MTTSFLVRIFDAETPPGDLAGRVTEVESGVAAVFQTVDELVTLLQGLSAERQTRRQSAEGEDK